MNEPIQRKLAAILAADVAGYSRLMSADESGTFTALTELRRIVDSIIHQRSGRIANTAGDSVLAEFPSVLEAVQCAVEMQQALAAWNADQPAERRMELRVGVHVGDVMIKDNDIFGDGVNVAARLQALAAPGGIMTSRSVRDLLRDKSAVFFDDRGEQKVKNVTRPVRVFEIRLAAQPADPQDEPTTASAAGGAEADQTELTFWDSVKDSEIADDYATYLERYPDGSFAALAQTRIDSLTATPPAPSAHEVELELAYWESVKDSNDPALLRAYLEKYPAGHFKELAAAILSSIEGDESRS